MLIVQRCNAYMADDMRTARCSNAVLCCTDATARDGNLGGAAPRNNVSQHPPSCGPIGLFRRTGTRDWGHRCSGHDDNRRAAQTEITQFAQRAYPAAWRAVNSALGLRRETRSRRARFLASLRKKY